MRCEARAGVAACPTLAATVSDDLPSIRETGRLAPRDPAPPAPPAPPARLEPAPPPTAPAGRLGRRLLGTALLVATLGLGSCHALLLAIFG